MPSRMRHGVFGMARTTRASGSHFVSWARVVPAAMETTTLPAVAARMSSRSSTSGKRRFEELPDNAKRYVDGLQKLLGVEMLMISTGPGREHTITQGALF